jgi:WD40 repeat protein
MSEAVVQELDVFPVVAILLGAYDGKSHQVTSVAFDSEGKYLASCSGSSFFLQGSFDNTVRIWDVSTQPQDQQQHFAEFIVRGHHTFGATSVAFNPSGRYLASGYSDNNVRIWNVRTEQPVAETEQLVAETEQPVAETEQLVAETEQQVAELKVQTRGDMGR